MRRAYLDALGAKKMVDNIIGRIKSPDPAELTLGKLEARCQELAPWFKGARGRLAALSSSAVPVVEPDREAAEAEAGEADPEAEKAAEAEEAAEAQRAAAAGVEAEALAYVLQYDADLHEADMREVPVAVVPPGAAVVVQHCMAYFSIAAIFKYTCMPLACHCPPNLSASAFPHCRF